MPDNITPEQTAAEADSAQAGIRMDAETLEALKGSIEKWEAIVAGTGKNEGPNNCPLCMAFNSAFTRSTATANCDGCPVKARTGMNACEGSPYARYEQLEEEDADCFDPGEIDARMASVARDELDFLKSLLPKEVA